MNMNWRNVTMKRGILIALVAAAMMATGSPAFADGSPWLPDPETGSITISYVSQNATEFYHPHKDPLKDNLSQDTVSVEGRYGLSDEFAIDFRVGGARSKYRYPSPGMPSDIPIGQESYSGLTDTNVGIVYRVVDELVSPSLPSIALRAAGIIAGNYETGFANAIGDGGNGLELSAMIGKFFANRVALSGEFGYRDRDNNIPSDFFMNLSGGVLVMNSVGLSINYKLVDALSGLDIGEAPFSRHRFPQVEENIHFLGGTATFNVTDTTNVSVSYGEVIDGRNTAKSKVWSVSLGYSFDTF